MDHIGYTILAGDVDGTTYDGPWLARQGNAATFALQVIAMTGSTTLDVTIQTKDRDEADSLATSAGTFTQITATGTSDKRVTDLKELVRLQYTIGGTGSFRGLTFDVPTVAWERN